MNDDHKEVGRMGVTRRQLLKTGTVLGAATTLPMTSPFGGAAMANGGQPYLGEIIMFGGNFAPAGWAFCNGQLLPISENDALFTLIGTTYGGDGQETFALPNLQSRVPMHFGTGPTGTTYQLAEMAGTEQETLTVNQIPVHSHPALANTSANQAGPTNGVWAGGGSINMFANAEPNGQMAPNLVGIAGGSQPHDNMIPYLAITFIIALFGIFPSQT